MGKIREEGKKGPENQEEGKIKERPEQGVTRQCLGLVEERISFEMYFFILSFQWMVVCIL